MINSLSTDRMKELARAGAKLRLEELNAEIAALEQLLRGSGAVTAARGPRPGGAGRRHLSEAGRAAIAAAQKARWAKVRAEKSGTAAAPSEARTTATSTRQRPSMSAAARKAVGERMRKYWAQRRKANVAQAGGEKASAASKR